MIGGIQRFVDVLSKITIRITFMSLAINWQIPTPSVRHSVGKASAVTKNTNEDVQEAKNLPITKKILAEMLFW